jgi:hypothetical protein
MFRGIWQRLTPGPQSDLQRRLRHIADEAKKIEEDPSDPPSRATVASLASLVGYLAKITEMHLREGET